MDVAEAKAKSGPLADKVHRWATFFSYIVILLMVAVFYVHVQAFRNAMHRHKENPHYQSHHGMGRCDDCHAYPSDMCESHTTDECLDCHADDGLATKLKYESELVLCTRCHAPEVFLIYEHGGVRKEIDLIRFHPYGMAYTEKTFPKTLPNTGRVVCTTCHDVHIQDPSKKLLRIYEPNEVLPRSVSPLCLDCHHQNGVL